MKRFFISILVVFVAVACSPNGKTTDIDDQAYKLAGEWQLIEQCECVFMANATFKPVSEQLKFFYKFTEKGSVETNRHKDTCNEGTYEIKSDLIYFDFQCHSYSLSISSVNDSELILEGTVDEGVMKYKFKKNKN